MMPYLIASGKRGRRILRFAIWLVCLGLLAGCKDDGAAAVPLTRVKAVTAEIVDFAPSITLTGVVAARVRTDLSFRLSGKISERLVNVGEHVVLNQVLARLDPDEQQAELVSAKAGVASGEAMVRQATAAFERQKDLLARGNTTRRDYDQADAALRSANAQLEQARSDLSHGAGSALLYRAARRRRRHHHRAHCRGRPGRGAGPADLHPGARRPARCGVQRP